MERPEFINLFGSSAAARPLSAYAQQHGKKSVSVSDGSEIVIGFFTVAALSITAAVNAFAADKCRSVQARCAVEVGGRCDPSTGRWDVNQYGAGGNNRAFMACLDRERRK
jgi:hypothetical protein